MGLCGGNPPDPSKGYAAGVLADLETLPWRRILESAATAGTPATINIPGGRGTSTPINVDFTGLGEGDYQAQYADSMAKQLLAMQEEFGPQFVEQRLHELQQSDPEGAAMRQRLWGAIQTDVADASKANRPVATDLQQLIESELAKGGELDPVTASRVSQSVLGRQTALGNYSGNAATTQEAEALGSASEQQAAQRQQEALAFLTSGATPEDVAYRREQQALGNLGAFVSGETPTAQFSQLSGAQNQIVPFTGASGPLPGVNPNAGAQGIDWANNVYSANMNWNNSQVSPWVAGLSGAAQGAAVVNAWRGPAAQTGPYNINPGGWARVGEGP